MCSTEDCPSEELPASQAATTQATSQAVMTTEDSEDETTASQSLSEDVDNVIDAAGPTKGDNNNLDNSDNSNTEVQNDPTTEIADDVVHDVTTNIPVAESNQDNAARDTTTTPGDAYDEQEYEEHEPITNHDEDHNEDATAVTVGGRVQCYTCGSLFSSPTSDQTCDSFTPEAGQVAECGDGEVGDTTVDTSHCRTQAPGSS